MLDDPDFESKLKKVPQGAQGLEGALFVQGFSECGVEFPLDHLFKLSWPSQPTKWLVHWNPSHPEELAQVLERNNFQLIVLSAMVGSWQYQLQQQYQQRRSQLTRLDASLKAAVEERGASLVLLCTEKTSHIYTGLFGKKWLEGCYVRTSCFRTQPALAALGQRAPAEVNAKAILLSNVPADDIWSMPRWKHAWWSSSWHATSPTAGHSQQGSRWCKVSMSHNRGAGSSRSSSHRSLHRRPQLASRSPQHAAAQRVVPVAPIHSYFAAEAAGQHGTT